MTEREDRGVAPMVEMGTERGRRLTRRTERKMIAGVAGGLADYFGVDAVWVRLAFVMATFLGGAGLIAYLVLMVIMPQDANSEPTSIERRLEHLARSMRGTPAWIGVGLLVVGALLILNQATNGRPGVFWGITLILLGVLFFRQREPKRASTELEAPAAVPGSAPPVPGAPPPLPGSSLPRAAVPSSPRVARERSALGVLTLGAIMVAEGSAAALDLGGAVHITLVQYLAIALVVLGTGIAVGAIWGRARWLIVPAVMLIPFVLVASLIKVPFEGGFADQSYSPATAASIASPYRLVGGQLVIDLTKTVLGTSPVTVTATAVAGRIRVFVPEGTPLVVDARTGAGEVSLFGRIYGGINVDVHRTIAGTKKVPPVHLDLETSLGQVEVRS